MLHCIVSKTIETIDLLERRSSAYENHNWIVTFIKYIDAELNKAGFKVIWGTSPGETD
jgi:hypothetical protein